MNLSSNIQPISQEESAPTSQTLTPPHIAISNLDLNLAGKPILQHVSLNMPATGITSLIGPSGAGKSSLLRCMNMLYDNWQGDISIQQTPIKQWQGGNDALRRFVGLIAQKPAVFPTSIAENVIFGLPRQQRKQYQAPFNQPFIQQCLEQSALWHEVKDRLGAPANTLSLGQQQRLCLARALALKPSFLLLDEPTSSLDPRSKQLIEASMLDLAATMPILCVTHDLDQALRLQGQVVFMCEGKVIESGDTQAFFNQPQRLETREFLRWSVCDCD